ncbi:MAG: hypothetical protein LBT20_07090 [Clostridiales bacterium]|jgi:hypothetical protein|nr:hypothetical protein [Clostridiales bacterium]
MKKTFFTILFWFWSCTWGFFATAAGLIYAGLMRARGFRPKVYHGNIYFEGVREAGGFNLGPFFFLGTKHSEYTKMHEAGHGIQNLILGPFYPLVVGIISELWFNKWSVKNAEHLKTDDWTLEERWDSYEKCWVERSASELGKKFYGIRKEE